MEEKDLPNTHFPFVASYFTAYPERQPRGELCNHFDLVAVLTGRRKAAMIPLQAITDNELGRYLLLKLHNHGQAASLAVNLHGQFTDVAIGDTAAVSTICAVCQAYRSEKITLEQYHRNLGAALGYPSEAIELFLSPTGAPLSRLAATLVNLVLPPFDDDPYHFAKLPDGRFLAVT